MNSAFTDRVVERRTQVLSSWVTSLEVVVETTNGSAIFHGLEIADYALVCARTIMGLIPVVRQFRPVIGATTLEFPSGHVDPGESPHDAARREFYEETGLTAKNLIMLGSHWTDTGRLTNRLHAYFTEANEPLSHECREPGVELEFLTTSELESAIQDGRFGHFLHVGAYALAKLRGFL
jgi:8-oxo-dGTP pyrophosphatase MutT (NUDIX family)